MFNNRIAKAFVSRRNLLQGTFPSAYQFLVQLETQTSPAVWMSTAKNAHVYWRDSFLMHIRFIGLGEVNTGMRISAHPHGQVAEGTSDRSELIFNGQVQELIESHGGFRNRWGTTHDDDSIELRHPAPGAFFRDLITLLERAGLRDRADRMARELEQELEKSEVEHIGGRQESPPPPRALPRRAAVARLRPEDTQRLLTVAHLVDAYFDYVAHQDDPDDERRAHTNKRLAALESLFLCRLPRPQELSVTSTSDRAMVAALAWRCAMVASRLESPFLAPPSNDGESIFAQLWETHGGGLGLPIEALRKALRQTFGDALLSLFPGVDETRIAQADLSEWEARGSSTPGR